MTESNITKEHEGKHGVLTLGGSRIEGTITSVGTVSFSVRIDVSKGMSGLCMADRWQFTPDPDPLPTEPGWYMCTSVVRARVPGLYFLSVDGIWSVNQGHMIIPASKRSMTETHANDPLVRVSFGVAS